MSQVSGLRTIHLQSVRLRSNVVHFLSHCFQLEDGPQFPLQQVQAAVHAKLERSCIS